MVCQELSSRLDGFAVGEVAGVHLPRAVGQIGDGGKTRDDCLRFRLEIGDDFSRLFGGLGLRADGEEGDSGKGDKASKGILKSQTARPEFRCDGHGVLAPRSILRHADAEMVTIPQVWQPSRAAPMPLSRDGTADAGAVVPFWAALSRHDSTRRLIPDDRLSGQFRQTQPPSMT